MANESVNAFESILLADPQYASQALHGAVSLFETLAAVERLLRIAHKNKLAAITAEIAADVSITELQRARSAFVTELLISYGRDPA